MKSSDSKLSVTMEKENGEERGKRETHFKTILLFLKSYLHSDKVAFCSAVTGMLKRMFITIIITEAMILLKPKALTSDRLLVCRCVSVWQLTHLLRK